MHSDFRRYLQDEFVNRSERNRRYSLRAFAKALNIGSSDLSKILANKRGITPKLVRRLAEPLKLSDTQVRLFVNSLKNTNATSSEETNFRNLSDDTFRIVADWYHFGILELMKLSSFQADVNWIAKQLQLSPVAVNIAIERLQRVGFILVNSDGSWRDGVGPTSMISNFRSTKARRHLQQQVLELAVNALDNVPITEREQSAVIMAIDSSRLEDAKRLIDKFRRDLIAVLAGPNSNKDRVAILNLSLFPATPKDLSPNHNRQNSIPKDLIQ